MHPIECELAAGDGAELVPSLTRVALAAARGESRASAAAVTIQAEAPVATAAMVNLSVFIIRLVSVVCRRQWLPPFTDGYPAADKIPQPF